MSKNSCATAESWKNKLALQAHMVNLTNTAAERKRLDYHHVSLTHEALVETFDRLDAIVRRVAVKKEAILIEASAHLSGKEWALYDHVHLDRKGQGSEA